MGSHPVPGVWCVGPTLCHALVREPTSVSCGEHASDTGSSWVDTILGQAPCLGFPFARAPLR